MKVLLVEDESPLATILARNLQVRGHDVTLKTTAEGAILSMVEEWTDALVIDVNLPDHSGWEILRRLTPSDRDRLRIVVTSAAPISPKRVSEFRPAHTLQKPFPIEALVRALEDRVELEVGDD